MKKTPKQIREEARINAIKKYKGDMNNIKEENTRLRRMVVERDKEIEDLKRELRELSLRLDNPKRDCYDQLRSLYYK